MTAGAFLILQFTEAPNRKFKTSTEPPATAQAIHSPRSEPDAASTKPAFHWSQIDSADFPTYVSNLRSIGCPEATIKNIVSSELEDIYTEKRLALEQKAIAGNTARRSLDMEIQKLTQEEAVVKTRLFSSSNDQSADLTSPIEIASQNVEAARVPLALQAVYAASPNVAAPSKSAASNAGTVNASNAVPRKAPTLTEDQQAGLADVQNKFIQDVGGTAQNPQDPAYLARWQTAQEGSDAMMRAKLGWKAFNEFQLSVEP